MKARTDARVAARSRTVMRALMSTRTLVALIVVCGTIARGHAAHAGAPVVTIGDVPVVTARAGDTVEVHIPMTVAPGHHIQANPASGEFLVPMEVRFETAAGVEVASVTYPEASRYRLEGTTEDLLTCHGSVVVVVRIAIAASAAPGERAFAGTLEYQACTSRMCFFPASVPVVIPMEVATAN